MLAAILTYLVLLLLSLPAFWYQVVASAYVSNVDPTQLAQHPKHNGILGLIELFGSVVLAALVWAVGGALLGLRLDTFLAPVWLTLFSIAQFIVCTKLRTMLMKYYEAYIETLPRPPQKSSAMVDYDSYLIIHNTFYLLALSIALWLAGRWV